MDDRKSTVSQAATKAPPARRLLMARARRVPWGRLQACGRGAAVAQGALRLPLGGFLRLAALAAATATGLPGEGSAWAQAVELSDVQAGRGGFAIHGKSKLVFSFLSVAGVGDVNGDGLADLLIGAPRADPGGQDSAGESFVVFGKPEGKGVELAEILAGRGGFAVRGSAAHDQSGSSTAGAGDVNGDGLADLLVGASEADAGGRENAGASYVIHGKAGGEAVELAAIEAGRGGFAIRGSAAGDDSGRSISGAGDVDGDGLADDLIVASGLSSAWYPEVSGAAYVIFGPATAPPPPRFRRGAVRGAEALDISDAVRLLGYLFLGDGAPPCLDAADADDSGGLDVSDAVRVLGHLFLGAASPPAPGPVRCGPDPTADKLGCAAPPPGCAQ